MPNINNTVTFGWLLDFPVTAMRPFCRMSDDTGPDHIHVDIYQALKELCVRFDRGDMVAVFPKCPFAMFTLIVFLGCPSCDELQTSSDDVLVCIFHQ